MSEDIHLLTECFHDPARKWAIQLDAKYFPNLDVSKKGWGINPFRDFEIQSIEEGKAEFCIEIIFVSTGSDSDSQKKLCLF